MSDADTLAAKLEQARRELRTLAGVVGVGYGYKERGGALTQELSFRVYVDEKKPASDLSPDDRVPAELLGIRTDVLTVIDSSPFACEILDAFSPLVGGIGITPLKNLSGATTPFGTLGCVATNNHATSRDNVVALTNRHVFEDGGAVAGDAVYQPKLERTDTGYKALTPETLHPIGTILNLGVRDHRPFAYPGETAPADGYWVDCAVARVDTCYSSWCKSNCGVGWANEITGLAIDGSSALEGIDRIVLDKLPAGGDYVVYKVGRTTGRTVGKVTDAAATLRDPTTKRQQHNCLVVNHLGPSCGGGTTFVSNGDSGSVIVNKERKAVGLVFGGTPGGTDGHGCHIHPVVDALGITLITTATPRAASGVQTLGELRADDDGDEAIARAAALRDEILWSEHGQMLHGVARRHRDEVAHLVNHVRGVTIAWHRARGPDFVAHAIHASRHAGYAVPRELDGIARGAALARVSEALERHASPALRADLDLHGDALRALAAEIDDLETLAERVRSMRPAAPLAGSP